MALVVFANTCVADALANPALFQNTDAELHIASEGSAPFEPGSDFN